MVQVNGKMMAVVGKSVSEVLESMDLDQNRVVVEINKEILKKVAYDDYKLNKGDQVEIVCFVGGG